MKDTGAKTGLLFAPVSILCTMLSKNDTKLLQNTNLQVALAFSAAVDDVLAMIILRHVGGNARVYVAGDVLTRHHEAEGLTRIESHAGGSQRHFYLHYLALLQLLVTVKALYGDDVGRELLVQMAAADAQTPVGT